VDFATVRVYSREAPEGVVPTIFATLTPASSVLAGEPVNFRLWPQGSGIESMRIDFGDEAVLEDYVPYSSISHKYERAGIHVVTASASSGTLPVTQKLKVIVEG
jgi:hypothetical protein